MLMNTIEKHLYISVKMVGGGEHRPDVECNRHNWCSVGVTTAPFFCVHPVYISPNKFDLQVTEKRFFPRSSSAPLTSIWKRCEILTTSKERENQCFNLLEWGNWALLYWQCLGSCSILPENSWHRGISLWVIEHRQIFKTFVYNFWSRRLANGNDPHFSVITGSEVACRNCVFRTDQVKLFSKSLNTHN